MEEPCFWTALAAIYPNVLSTDLMRYLIGAGGLYLIVNLALAGRMAGRKIRERTPDYRQIGREIVVSLRTVLIFALNGTLFVFGATQGVFTVYTDVAAYGVAYLIGSTVLMILAHDAWFYWSHRAMHLPRLFRWFHRVHHKSHNPTPFTSYSFDASEAVVNAIFFPIFLFFVPAHPIMLLIFTSHMMLRNAMGHCGYELFPANRAGKPLFDWMTTVTHHDLHHSNARYNMALYFTWWDRWMGTEHPEYHARFAQVGRPIGRGPAVAGLAVLLAGGLFWAAADAEELRGTYASPGLGIVVAFEPCGAQNKAVCGRLVWTWDEAGKQHAMPGDTILRGLTWDGSTWRGGKLLNPENGRTYRGSITVSGPDTLRLKGCAGPLCTTQTWRSVRSIAHMARPVLGD